MRNEPPPRGPPSRYDSLPLFMVIAASVMGIGLIYLARETDIFDAIIAWHIEVVLAFQRGTIMILTTWPGQAIILLNGLVIAILLIREAAPIPWRF